MRQLLIGLALSLLIVSTLRAQEASLKLLRAPVYHILPETHNNESGYFALCEGLDGRIYVGTAKYGENAYLVEFDPKTKSQRIVVDTNAVTGATGKGYASQSKIHTRNYVGPSGRIYMGSKQGYPLQDEKAANRIPPYPGGYVLVFDPATGKTQNYGIPYPGQGLADVMADESRGLMYVVTCEEQYWMVLDMKKPAEGFRWLGPNLAAYATTLVDPTGKAHAITKDFKLATYDPESNKLTERSIMIDGKLWADTVEKSVPTWQLAPDGQSAYLILMKGPSIYRIDLSQQGNPTAKALGRIIDNDETDSRNGLSLGADGMIYVALTLPNPAEVGKGGRVTHLCRMDPATGKSEDLGLLAIENPEFFEPLRGKPWTNGLQSLPDGSQTPKHVQMSCLVSRDNTVYVVSLAPFILWQIDDFRK